MFAMPYLCKPTQIYCSLGNSRCVAGESFVAPAAAVAEEPLGLGEVSDEVGAQSTRRRPRTP